jgi:N-acetyl-alpha-D-glucosaminyl L-malate synthase BshA
MHVSNFRPVKNIEAVMRVFAELCRRESCRLALVGEGPEQARAEELAVRLGVEGQVSFLGNQEYIEELLPSADLFLLPSHHESFGLVALEAMSAGVPVIATNVGGTVEVIEDGRTGYLRAPGDIDGMVEAGLTVLGNPDGARRMGEAARQAAVERFDVEKVVPRYVDLYRRSLD